MGEKLTEEELWEAFDNPMKVVRAASGFGWKDCLDKGEFENILRNKTYYCFEIREILPYEGMEEFLHAQEQHGPYLRFVNVPERVSLPCSVTTTDVEFRGYAGFERIGYRELMGLCRWQDGSICGTLGKTIG